VAACVPHSLILCGLQIVARLAVISWFAIVFTGGLPERLAKLLCLYLRYNGRATVKAGFRCGARLSR
jgi:hypothetical protein